MKIIKTIFITLISLIVFIIVGIFIAIQIFTSESNTAYDTDKVNELITVIKSQEQVPDNFKETYHNVHKSSSTNKYVFNKIINKKNNECSCLAAAKIAHISHANNAAIYKRNSFILSKKLEKECTQDECLNFLLNNFDFLYAQVGIKNAAEFYFDKNIHDLNETEHKTLIVMMKNPALYNPKKYPDKLEAKLKEL